MAKNWNKKLRGFTMLELMVVMLLSTLVLAFAYTSLRHVQKLFKGYKEQSGFINSITSLRSRLSQDFVFADAIWELEPGHYRIQKDSLIKEFWLTDGAMVYSYKESRDSLNLATSLAEVKYKDFSGNKSLMKLVSGLNIKFKFKEEEFEIQLKKTYRSDFLLQLMTKVDAKS